MKHMYLLIYLIFKSRNHTTLTKTSQDSPNRNARNSVVFLASYISSYSRPRLNTYTIVPLKKTNYYILFGEYGVLNALCTLDPYHKGTFTPNYLVNFA